MANRIALDPKLTTQLANKTFKLMCDRLLNFESGITSKRAFDPI